MKKRQRVATVRNPILKERAILLYERQHMNLCIYALTCLRSYSFSKILCFKQLLQLTYQQPIRCIQLRSFLLKFIPIYRRGKEV